MKNQFEETSDFQKKYIALAKWIEQLMVKTPVQADTTTTSGSKQFLADYHPHFYKQIPDFIMALLNKDPRASLDYAPLLYHLVGCTACHTAYLELYDALHEAMQPDEVYVPTSLDTATYATTPPRMVMQLCQLLISQAETVKRQARRDHTNGNDLARSLLQQALEISRHLTLEKMRQQALHELVYVATLFDDFTDQGPALDSFSPHMATGAGSRSGGTTVRRIEAPLRPAGPPVILLQSNALSGFGEVAKGSIAQNGDILELHLQGLDKKLHGQNLTINVPLGSLIEPVRWVGGNPRAIRSATAVDGNGTLTTPLGQTELRLTETEDYNLLEAMFLRLEIRVSN